MAPDVTENYLVFAHLLRKWIDPFISSKKPSKSSTNNVAHHHVNDELAVLAVEIDSLY
jgi:hypothetical protein